MKTQEFRFGTVLGLGLLLLVAAGAQAEILLTPGDFHPPSPETMPCDHRGILLPRTESAEPTATTIPFPEALRGAGQIKVTVYFIPEDPELTGDICLCARTSSDSPGEEAFQGADYASLPQTVDSEWGEDWLGSSEIIIPGYMREGEIIHIGIYRDIDQSFQDTYPGGVWFTAVKLEAIASS
jgi:hypothetical protein